MLRFIALLALFGCAMCMPFQSINDIPEQYRELIPAEAKEFLTGLTDADKQVLKEVAKDYASYKNEDEALEALKKKSPELGAKAEKLHKLVKDKIDALGEEARAFAKEVIAGARKLQAQVVAGERPSLEVLKTKAQSAIAKYKALSEDAKTDLQTQFPILTKVFKSEKFQKLAETFLATAN